MTGLPARHAQSGRSLTEVGQGGPTVAASYALCLLDVAAARGAVRERLLSLAGLRDESLQPATRRLPVAQMLALFDAVRRETGDEAVGLHMGQQVLPRTFNALGYAAMSCSVLGEAIAMIPRYESLVYDGGSTSVRGERDTLVISWRSGLPAQAESRALNEVIVAGWLGFGRWITGRDAPLREVRFRHAAPALRTEYEAYFGCPLRFSADENALCIGTDLLRLPLVYRDDELRRLMERQAEALLSQVQSRRTFSAAVVACVQERLPKGVPQAEEVARQLGLGERTLRRRLHGEGHSFMGLLTQVRHELALHYLAQPRLSVLETALLLGFSEQSAFTAAFKAWQGLTPSAYRRQCAA